MFKATPCPHCNGPIDLMAQVEEEASRDVFGAMIGHPAAGQILVYLGLFKPRKQFLRWTRAKALLDELMQVIEAYQPQIQIAALSRTVAALEEKRQSPSWTPLKDHHYLMRVLESCGDQVLKIQPTDQQKAVGSSTMRMLEELHHA